MLSVDSVHVAIGGHRALDGVSLDVHDGSVTALLGPSGSGKTTLLRAVAGLQRVDRGRVLWDGEDLTTSPPEKRRFGMMFQDHALFPHRTVGDNVAFGLRMRGLNRSAVHDRVEEMLALVRLSGLENRPIAGLSGGEQQRVALARAMAPSPRLLLLDEPLGSLDRSLRQSLALELQELFAATGTTAIVVTHDHEEALTLGETVAVLDQGRVEQSGSGPSLWQSPANEKVARFLGMTTIVDADVQGGTASFPWGRLAHPGWSDGRHRVVVPAHAITVHSAGQFDGVVRNRSFRGARLDVTVRTESGIDVHAQTPMPGPALKEPVRFDVDVAALVRLEQ